MKAPAAILAVLLASSVSSAAEEEFIAPAENLVVEGVPKIPASLAEQVGRFQLYATVLFMKEYLLK